MPGTLKYLGYCTVIQVDTPVVPTLYRNHDYDNFLLPNGTRTDGVTSIRGFGWCRGEMLWLVVAPHRGKTPFNNHTPPVVMTEMRLECHCNLRVTTAASFGCGNYSYIASRYATAAVLPNFRGLASECHQGSDSQAMSPQCPSNDVCRGDTGALPTGLVCR
jgi:hypothetical protein